MTPQYVDPTKFDPTDIFYVVLVNNSQDFVSWGIKDDTGSNYNHAMTQRSLTLLDCQEMGHLFQTVPIGQYLVKQNILKFWNINDLTHDEWSMLNSAVEKDLTGPLWSRFYNYLGVVGQFFRMPWLSMPDQCFCSQRVAKYLRMLPRFASVLPANVSPGFEDAFFTAHPELMTCVGYWWED